MDGSGRFSECVKKWTTAKPDAQHDVFFILVTGAPTHPNLTCSIPPKIAHNFLLSQSQQLDKFDFDKFHQNIEDAKTKGGQVHIS